MSDDFKMAALKAAASDELRNAAIKGGPGVVGAVFYSFTLNEWVAIVTLIYLALQIGLLLPKYFEMFRTWLKKKTG